MTNRMIYIHIPFCVKKCAYCDFASYCVRPNDEIIRRYVDALCDEIAMYADKDVSITSIYIGGGTPSFLYSGAVERIMCAVREHFTTDIMSECSIEVNPGVVDDEKLREYLDCGINRVSMGVQSFNDVELHAIGRVHSAYDAKQSYKLIRKWVDNVSLDIMTGLPGQTLKSLESTLRQAVSLAPKHVSCYALTLAEGTPLYGDVLSGRATLPDEDLSADLSDMAWEYLTKNGYGQYEISNYALPGYECRHNVGYWEQKEYYGFGAAASGYFRITSPGERYSNMRSTADYIDAVHRRERPIESQEILDTNTSMFEYIMLGLRMNRGILCENFRDKFDKNLLDVYTEAIDSLTHDGLMIADESGICLTKRGMDTHNACVIKFLK